MYLDEYDVNTSIVTRATVVRILQKLYDSGQSSVYPINNSTVSDIFCIKKQKWLRGITIAGLRFHTRMGMLYKNFRDRCKVGGKKQLTQKHYEGATYCEEWRNFQNFALWAIVQEGLYMRDERNNFYELDSDLFAPIGSGKHYSPATCCFVPKNINLALSGNGSRGYYKLPSNKFRVVMSKYGKSVFVGLYDKEKDAIKAYRKQRIAYIKELAQIYRYKLSVSAYAALRAYKQI